MCNLKLITKDELIVAETKADVLAKIDNEAYSYITINVKPSEGVPAEELTVMKHQIIWIS